MLATRVLTAVVLLLVLLPILLLGSQDAVSAVALVLLAIACWEWWRLLGHRGRTAFLGVVLFLIVCVAGRLAGAAFVWIAVAIATAFWCVVAPWWLHDGIDGPARRRVLAVVGVFAIAAVWWSLGMAAERGPVYLLSILALVWISDIAAYFVGRALGRHKLAPAISPGKTWEGVAGALIATVAVAWIAARSDELAVWPNFVSSLFAEVPFLVALVAIAILVLLGIVGDLFESLLKRRAGVKDSGGLLPGHGGLLDRIDAVIPVLPAAILVDLFARAHFK